MRSGLFALQRLENSAFPVSSLKAKPRNLSCISVITIGVFGGRLNTSRFSSSNIQRFPACKGDPSAALGMTVRGSSLSVSLGTFDPSASRILIKKVRVCAHHLIEERQYPWSLIPNPCFQTSGATGTTNLLAEVCHIINAEEFFPTPCDEENLAFDDLE